MNSHYMVRYIRRAGPHNLLVLWLLGCLFLGLQLVTPVQVAVLTDLFQDQQTRPPEWTDIHRAIFWILGAQLALSLLSYWQRYGGAVFRQNLTACLTLDVFSRLLRFPPEFFLTHKPETINTRTLEDTRCVAGYWSEAMQNAPLAVLSLLVFGGYMIATNWFLGLCLVPLSLLSGYFLVFDRLIQRLNRQVRDTWDEVRVRSHEVVSGVGEIRNHAAFDYGWERVRASLQEYVGLMKQVGHWNAFFRAAGPLVAAVQSTTLYWLGAALCLAGSRLSQFAGELTWGEVISFLLVAALFREPIQTIAGFLLQSRMTRENLRRVVEYLEQPLAFTPAGLPLDTPGPLVFEQVQVTTQAGNPILHDFSAAIPRGQHAALVGPAGCGKSTAIRLLVRGVSPARGRVRLGKIDLEQYQLESLAAQIGFVPQHPVLLDTTVRQNLLLGLRRSSSKSIRDPYGPLDLQAHPHVHTLQELEAVLISAVERVGLETDLVSKALDNCLPASAAFEPFRERLLSLRTDVHQRLVAIDSRLLTRFELDRVLVPGSVQENLFGPGSRPPSTAEQARLLLQLAEQAAEVQMLVTIGWRRFLADRALAVQAAQRAPRLARLLADSQRHTAVDSQVLMGTGPANTLPDETRQALLQLALETDLDAVLSFTPPEPLETVLLALRHRLACLPEQDNRWAAIAAGDSVAELSLRENILAGRIDRRNYHADEQVEACLLATLEHCGMRDLAILAGLETRVGENGKFLSGGQRQKVALARVLLKNPAILLLDEATANLDEISQTRIVEMLRRDFTGKTVLSISHRLATVRHCDQILVLEHGQLVQQGPPQRLARQPGLFRTMLAGELPDTTVAGPPSPDHAAAGVPPDAQQTTPPDQVAAAIRACDLFRGLDSLQIAALERSGRLQHCSEHQVIFHRGDPGDELFLICHGQVEFRGPATAGTAAVAETVDSFGPGQVFGELALFGDVPRTLSAYAQTAATLLTVSREKMLELMDADPDISLKLLKVLAQRIAALRNQPAA